MQINDLRTSPILELEPLYSQTLRRSSTRRGTLVLVMYHVQRDCSNLVEFLSIGRL